MSRKFFNTSLILSVFVLSFLGLGCTTKQTISEGGVYKSVDNGKTWQQVVYVGQTEDRVVTIADLSIKQLAYVSSDNTLILAAAGASGLYLTNNAGQNWQRIGSLTADIVAANKVNPNLIYVASGNKIFKTDDQGKNWSQVYVDTTPKNSISLLSVDSSNPAVVYAGTTSGTALLSQDSGASWQQIYFFKTALVDFVKQSNGDLYFADNRGHMWRSTDAGKTWTDTVEALKTHLKTGIGQVLSISKVPGEVDGIIMSTTYGLHKTSDGGKTWSTFSLLTSPRSVTIENFLIDPADAKYMWYTASQALYRTDDAGKTWETLQLPSRRTPKTLTINQDGTDLLIGFVK